jgi:hypothetical protein
MSKQLNHLVTELQGNMELVGDFFDNPSKVIDSFGITGKEKQALLARDLNSLNKIGLSEQQIVGALSGAHSSQCHALTL